MVIEFMLRKCGDFSGVTDGHEVHPSKAMTGRKSELDTQSVSDIVQKLRSIAIHSLTRMYRPEERLFAFRLRKNGQNEVLEGVSHRYTAMVLIGLAGEAQDVVKEVLDGHSREDVCGRLLGDINKITNLGDVAITTWAARALGHAQVSKAIGALQQLEPGRRPYPTMELSWALTALTVDGSDAKDEPLANDIADALIATFNWESGIFNRWAQGCKVSKFRAHASCFADFVYPIQALSYYHLTTGNAKALEAAIRCAECMCELQGPEGQWWWYYDARTGRVLERYPVYAVHQDAMAPMALFALSKASGRNYLDSIEKSLHWLVNPTEVKESLIGTERNIIWRKVARREPMRTIRGLQAACSYIHPKLRVPGVDVFYPPVSIDYESRPYHMGWILHAWPANCDKKTMTQTPAVNKT